MTVPSIPKLALFRLAPPTTGAKQPSPAPVLPSTTEPAIPPPPVDATHPAPPERPLDPHTKV